MAEGDYMYIRSLMLMVVGLLGCCVIQAKCDASTSDQTYVVEGVGFGEMKKFIDTESGVYHMEFDVADSRELIFSDQRILKSTYAGRISSLVGSGYGYMEGQGDAALFNVITGFSQLNRSSIIIVDSWNHCLRHVDRENWQTSPFVGQCTESGSKDGHSASFIYPRSVIKDQRDSNKLLVTEAHDDRVRQVDTLTRETIAILDYWSGLMSPVSLAFDFLGTDLLVANYYEVMKCDLTTYSCSTIAGSYESGNRDGRLTDARFGLLRELVPLTDSLILVADYENDRLRIINTASDSVSSVCKGLSGFQYKPAETCSLNQLLSLLVKDDIIYLGQYGAIQTIPWEEAY